MIRPRVLFVCLANQQRSPTAERVAKEMGFDARSAGMLAGATGGKQLSAEDIAWADEIVVMEPSMLKILHRSVHCLSIADRYNRNQPELVELLERACKVRLEEGAWPSFGQCVDRAW